MCTGHIPWTINCMQGVEGSLQGQLKGLKAWVEVGHATLEPASQAKASTI